MDSTHRPHVSIITWVTLVAGLFPLLIISACSKSDDNEAAIAGGRADFQAYCASCHGREAKGNGPVADKLKSRPADLTILSKKFDGVFPAEYVLRTIDGRQEIMAHGSRTMPVWGKIWRSENDPESEAETQRILTELLAYLESIQQKG
jgi:mono/diheme cytochrome c family protein